MDIKVNPEEVKGNVNKAINSLASLKANTPAIKVKFTKNKLTCLTKLENSGTQLKSIVDSYASKYQKNLADLTKGVMVLEELDSSLANAVKSAEDSNNYTNMKTRESGFYR